MITPLVTIAKCCPINHWQLLRFRLMMPLPEARTTWTFKSRTVTTTVELKMVDIMVDRSFLPPSLRTCQGNHRNHDVCHHYASTRPTRHRAAASADPRYLLPSLRTRQDSQHLDNERHLPASTEPVRVNITTASSPPRFLLPSLLTWQENHCHQASTRTMRIRTAATAVLIRFLLRLLLLIHTYRLLLLCTIVNLISGSRCCSNNNNSWRHNINISCSVLNYTQKAARQSDLSRHTSQTSILPLPCPNSNNNIWYQRTRRKKIVHSRFSYHMDNTSSNAKNIHHGYHTENHNSIPIPVHRIQHRNSSINKHRQTPPGHHKINNNCQ
mmetsp:Transcript_3283/g.3632  ORF Transcript_3283/g.3632 Transcript_3283/m.3632 type:complete len:326 (+) Transcript_3283:364-1341(+)